LLSVQNRLHLLVELVVFGLQFRLHVIADFSECIVAIVINPPNLFCLIIAQQQLLSQATDKILHRWIGHHPHGQWRRAMMHHRHAEARCSAANENHRRQQNRRPFSSGHNPSHDHRLAIRLIGFSHGN
jgi:hypothetical protein